MSIRSVHSARTVRMDLRKTQVNPCGRVLDQYRTSRSGSRPYASLSTYPATTPIRPRRRSLRPPPTSPSRARHGKRIPSGLRRTLEIRAGARSGQPHRRTHLLPNAVVPRRRLCRIVREIRCCIYRSGLSNRIRDAHPTGRRNHGRRPKAGCHDVRAGGCVDCHVGLVDDVAVTGRVSGDRS
jgi:hypothetical protein